MVSARPRRDSLTNLGAKAASAHASAAGRLAAERPFQTWPGSTCAQIICGTSSSGSWETNAAERSERSYSELTVRQFRTVEPQCLQHTQLKTMKSRSFPARVIGNVQNGLVQSLQYAHLEKLETQNSERRSWALIFRKGPRRGERPRDCGF